MLVMAASVLRLLLVVAACACAGASANAGASLQGLAAAGALVERQAVCSQLFSQCGGRGFTGSSVCCPGSLCVVANAFFSQCQADPSCPKPVTSTVTRTFTVVPACPTLPVYLQKRDCPEALEIDQPKTTKTTTKTSAILSSTFSPTPTATTGSSSSSACPLSAPMTITRTSTLYTTIASPCPTLVPPPKPTSPVTLYSNGASHPAFSLTYYQNLNHTTSTGRKVIRVSVSPNLGYYNGLVFSTVPHYTKSDFRYFGFDISSSDANVGEYLVGFKSAGDLKEMALPLSTWITNNVNGGFTRVWVDIQAYNVGDEIVYTWVIPGGMNQNELTYLVDNVVLSPYIY